MTYTWSPKRPGRSIIVIRRGAYRFIVPVNPETLSLTRSRDYTEVDIINYRSVGRLGATKLRRFEFSSVMLRYYDENLSNYRFNDERRHRTYPESMIQILDGWIESRRPEPVFLTITGTRVNLPMVITRFDWEERAGEPDAVYYTLGLQEYVASSTKLIGRPEPIRSPGPAAPSTAGTRYVVKPGDYLWKIAQRYYGKGHLWPRIWDVNKPMRSGNPNLIYAGEVITIPPL